MSVTRVHLHTGLYSSPISNRDGLSYGKALNLSSAVRQTARERLRDRRRCFHDEVASHNIQRFDLFYQLLEFVDRFDGTYPDPVQRGHHSGLVMNKDVIQSIGLQAIHQ